MHFSGERPVINAGKQGNPDLIEEGQRNLGCSKTPDPRANRPEKQAIRAPGKVHKSS
jgi:hypothetical protein